MGESKSMVVILGILVYFILFFLIVQGSLNSARYYGVDDGSISINDPGFQEKFQAFDETGGICRGGGRTGVIGNFNRVLCHRLDVFEDEDTCNDIPGCTWANETSLFGFAIRPARCEGKVNTSEININATRSTYCENSPALQESINCSIFQCNWVNQTQLAEEFIEDQQSFTNVWQTVKFVAFFRAELGMGGFTWIFSMIFFWLPLVALILAIYFALPFLH